MLQEVSLMSGLNCSKHPPREVEHAIPLDEKVMGKKCCCNFKNDCKILRANKLQ